MFTVQYTEAKNANKFGQFRNDYKEKSFASNSKAQEFAEELKLRQDVTGVRVFQKEAQP